MSTSSPEPVRLKSFVVETYVLGVLLLIAVVFGIGTARAWHFDGMTIVLALVGVVLSLFSFRLIGRWLGGRP